MREVLKSFTLGTVVTVPIFSIALWRPDIFAVIILVPLIFVCIWGTGESIRSPNRSKKMRR